MRKLDAGQDAITLSAADPLNLVGILVSGERVPAISGNSVTFRDGVAIDGPVISVPAVSGPTGNEAVAS
jgi:ATP-dependent Lhr-like helicase